MDTNQSKRHFLQVLAASPCLIPAASRADDWPSKAVKIIVPYAPGGVTDMLTRLIAAQLSVSLKQPVYIENLPGASGMIGSDRAAKAAPDGYTLLASGMASLVIAPNAGKTPFEPMDSFTHIALLGGPPLTLAVHPSVPVKDVKTFIAYANAQQNGLSYGSPGTGTHNHLMGELFRTRTNTNMTHIPYKGGGPATVDLLGGHIPAAFLTFSTVAEDARAGKLKLLAVTSPQRLPGFENLATFAEEGHDYLTTNNWCSISGPAGLPKHIVAKLNTEIRNAMRSTEVQQVMAREFIDPNDLDPAVFTDFFRNEITRWAPVIKAADLKLGA